MQLDYNSPSALREFLDAKGMGMQKKFGQNFLINEGARKKIVAALGISKGTSVWEVGPGLGCMTKELLECGADVTAFEIDRGFAAGLKDFFEPWARQNMFRIVEGDVLKNWKGTLEQKGLPECFFGNLPYNIAATLIARTIEQGVRFEKCAFTVQREVALRMCAMPSDKDYSSFSVLCRWAYDVKTICDLGRANFWPRPNVDSRAVLFTRKSGFPGCNNPQFFVKMQRALFANRRKTIKNNLMSFLSGYKTSKTADQILQAAGLEPNMRAEALDVGQLLHLSDFANEAIM